MLDTTLMCWILVLCMGYYSCIFENILNTPVPQVQLWRSALSIQRMSVLSKDASLVKGCKSCQRMPVLNFGENKNPCSPGAIMAKYLVKSKDVSLVEGC